MRNMLFLICFVFFSSLSQIAEASDDKSVLLAILARNKAHLLPEYLKSIENLEYDKKLISVYINTNNNTDNTKEILSDWMEANKSHYRSIELENVEFDQLAPCDPHAWTVERFAVLGKIRNRSMQKAIENKTDYYFVIDCDNFVNPHTLKNLIAQDKPIIAPLLRAIPEYNDHYSNYFCDIDQAGYYKNHADYLPILFRSKQGTFKVPVVHCTYLINSKYIDKLTYSDGSKDYEFVIFSKSARNNDVDQYICNDSNYGVLLHFFNDNLSLAEEAERFKNYLANGEAEAVFTKIYSSGDWGKHQGIGYSGSGSLPQLAKPYMEFLENFLRINRIKTVVDAGCGDWTFSQLLNWEGIDYVGFDVVKSVIDRNNANYSSPTIQFVCKNALSTELPSADLLLCKDVLQHCTDEDIAQFLPQLKKFKHCLITNDINPDNLMSQSSSIRRGDWRFLDLTLPPFQIKGVKIFTYLSGNVMKQVLYIHNDSEDN